jgi:tetratricopeptide (TPR) repeat protein
LPLALELAAARLNVLTPGEMLDRLDDRFALLVARSRDRPDRHETLAATIDWSYDALNADERAMFGRLSIFSGGFTVESAERVCARHGVARELVIDLISGLVDKSLLVSDQGSLGRRFRFLETVREYATTKLADSGEQSDLARSHAEYFRGLAVDSFDELRGPKEFEWLDRLERERPNLRRALRWHLANELTQEGLLMAGSLDRFWMLSFHLKEGKEWLERFLAADSTPSLARARALNGLGTVDWSDKGLAAALESVRLCRKLGSPEALYGALNNAGVGAMRLGHWETAREVLAECLERARERDDPVDLSFALSKYADVVLEADRDPAEAIALREESVRFARDGDSPGRLVTALTGLGWTRKQTGDLDGASEACQEALQLTDELGLPERAAFGPHWGLAYLSLDIGEIDQAVAHVRAATDHEDARRQRHEQPHETATEEGGLLIVARLAVERSRFEAAATILASEEAQIQQSNGVRAPSNQAELDETVRHVKSQLDPTSFDRAWDQGLGMTATQALEYALDSLEEATADPASPDAA